METPQSGYSDTERKPHSWTDLSEPKKQAALKHGYNSCGGQHMRRCGIYYTGELRSTAVTVHGMSGVLSGIFILVAAAWFSYTLDHDLEATSEAVHFTLICSNVLSVVIYFLFNRRLIDDIFTAVGAGFFSYGDTLDDETRRKMDSLTAVMKEKKEVRMKRFYYLVWACGFVMAAKSLLNSLRFRHLTDGEGGAVLKKMNCPVWFFGADKWPGYLFCVYVCFTNQLWTMTAVLGLILPTMAICEEITAQLELVGIGLRHLSKRAQYIYKKRFQSTGRKYSKCIEEAVRVSIRHHIVVLRVAQKLKHILQVPLLSMMVIVSILLCMQGFVLVEDSVPVWIKIGTSTFILTEVVYAFLFSAYGDNLSCASFDIGNQLYEDEWIKFSVVVRPYYTMIKLRSTKPFYLSAFGFANVNLNSFSSVLNSAYSYMNLMLSNKK